MTGTQAGELGLPEPFRIADFEGPTSEWLQRCRWQFEAIVDGHIQIDGRPLLACGDHDEVFWHATTGDVAWSETRWLDLGRCAVMGRVWDLLERLAAGDPRACFWREGHGRRKSLMVAPVDLSLIVVLRECRASVLFVTAWPLRQRKRARQMERVATRLARA